MILVEENPDMWECRCGFRKDLEIKRFRDIDFYSDSEHKTLTNISMDYTQCCVCHNHLVCERMKNGVYVCFVCQLIKKFHDDDNKKKQSLLSKLAKLFS